MANWKRTYKELPKNQQLVIYKDMHGYYYVGKYDAEDKLFLVDGDFTLDYNIAEDVDCWCQIPEFDLED